MTPIDVALIDDYEVVVHGLAAMLRNYRSRIRIVELDVDVPVQASVDLALFDSFANPQGDSGEVRELVQNPAVAKTVVYTWNFDQHRIAASLANGVAGYVSKALPAAELVAALEEIHRGGRQVYPAPAGASAPRPVAGDWPGREEGLSQREAEVLALITQGLTNDQIALRTALSANSIKTHIRNAYRKIGVTSRTRAVLWGVDNGFLPARGRTHPDPDD